MKVGQTFTIFYVILTVTEILAEITESTLLVYVTKPLLVISLTSFFILKTKNTIGFPDKNVFIGALLFALLGDIFLMIRGIDLFIPGLAAFLLMLWLYILVFGRKLKSIIFTTGSLLLLLPFLIYAMFLFIMISQKLDDPLIKSAIAIYALSISIMAWTAFVGARLSPATSTRTIFIGALLFVLSDSLIAVGRFISPVPMQDLLVMGTYAAAQFLITTGLLKANQAS